MPHALTATCMLRCSFGMAPTPLVSLPMPGKPTVSGMPVALVTDIVPMVNVMPFGMCTTQTNPMVAAATAAALGTPTPAPCIPVLAPGWAPPSACTSANGVPIATVDSKVSCTWGGLVEVAAPQQIIVQV